MPRDGAGDSRKGCITRVLEEPEAEGSARALPHFNGECDAIDLVQITQLLCASVSVKWG